MGVVWLGSWSENMFLCRQQILRKATLVRVVGVPLQGFLSKSVKWSQTVDLIIYETQNKYLEVCVWPCRRWTKGTFTNFLLNSRGEETLHGKNVCWETKIGEGADLLIIPTVLEYRSQVMFNSVSVIFTNFKSSQNFCC